MDDFELLWLLQGQVGGRTQVESRRLVENFEAGVRTDPELNFGQEHPAFYDGQEDAQMILHVHQPLITASSRYYT